MYAGRVRDDPHEEKGRARFTLLLNAFHTHEHFDDAPPAPTIQHYGQQQKRTVALTYGMGGSFARSFAAAVAN